MRIAQLITRGDVVGGAQRHVVHLSMGLRRLGHEVSVIAGGPNPAQLQAELDATSVDVLHLPGLGRSVSTRDMQLLSRLRRVISRLQPDVVAAHSSKAVALLALISQQIDAQAVGTIHGVGFAPQVRPAQRTLALLADVTLLRRLAAVIAVSEADRTALAHLPGLHHEKIITIRNGIDWQASRRYLTPPVGDPLRIVTVGRLEYQKNMSAALKAVAALRGAGHNITLTLVGDGSEYSALSREASQLNLNSTVNFLGECKDVASILNQHDVYLSTARYEGLPLATIEALRAGLPIVATDVGGVRELVSDGINGLLVKPTHADLCRALLAIDNNRESLPRYSESSRRLFENAFTAETMVARTVAVYQQVTGG